MKHSHALIVGLLATVLVGCQASPPAPAPTTPTPAAATPLGPTIGRQYLEKTRKAFKAKKWAEAARHGTTAADILVNEEDTAKELREAHKLAGQSHYKVKQFDKALIHYKALVKLEPGNKQHRQVVAELTRRTAKAKPPNPMSARLTPAQQARRDEANLNRKIRVRVTTPYNPMGTIETVTVREYRRRQASGEYR